MWTPKPSTTSERPIISRNPRHRTTTVGCRLTNSVSGRLASIIRPTAITTAITITVNSSTMPTAVMTESSENTASSTTIWTITCQNAAGARARPLRAARPFQALVQLRRALVRRNRPPAIRIRSRPDLQTRDAEQRRGERRDPGDAGEQPETHEQGEREAHEAGPVAPLRGQLVGEDRDEDQVVDAEHDLQHDEGAEPEPGGRVADPAEQVHRVAPGSVERLDRAPMQVGHAFKGRHRGG